ncbi:MAG: hypothetical protein QOF19_1112, partial [Alphaproteobacteria bacterium]|nr:hypothetical protein [Alphaproteobacteria bacterium]
MVLERLSFQKGTPPYHSFFAAQHSVRYSLVRRQLEGKRVLDVACGEGFGSYLMAEWGAAQVVGLDIAPDAIEVARSTFRHKKIRYILGDATKLSKVLAKERPFDIIVCFGTIEHLSDPVLFLDQLAKFRTHDGVVVISCPNDHILDEQNPFHKGRFTFEEFADLTTARLGSANHWLLGVPVLGQMNYLLGDPVAEHPGSEPINVIRLQSLSNGLVAPPQENIKPNPSNCTYYVGVWGGSITTNAVIAPQSHVAFVQPWRMIDVLQSEATNREQQINRYELEIKAQHLEIGDRERCLTEMRIQRQALDKDLAEVRREREVFQTELEKRSAQVGEAERRLVAYQRRIEVLRMRHYDEIQRLRRRVVHHANERSRKLEEHNHLILELARFRSKHVQLAVQLASQGTRARAQLALTNGNLTAVRAHGAALQVTTKAVIDRLETFFLKQNSRLVAYENRVEAAQVERARLRATMARETLARERLDTALREATRLNLEAVAECTRLRAIMARETLARVPLEVALSEARTQQSNLKRMHQEAVIERTRLRVSIARESVMRTAITCIQGFSLGLGRSLFVQLGIWKKRLATVEAIESEDRRLVEASGLFDPSYYKTRYLVSSGIDPLDHYMQSGGVEGCSPGPDF